MPHPLPVTARQRVLIDNDFGGDPDGLFQLAHHLLSPSVEVCGVIGSQHYANGFYGLSGSPDFAVELAEQLLKIICPEQPPTLLKGADEALVDTSTPRESAAADLIIREALHDDTSLPLYIACGAGLTNLASAYLKNAAIAERIRVIWIGGPEYAEQAVAPPNAASIEYNLGIDLHAARVVFESPIPLWQIPRNAYRQALVSFAEIECQLKRTNPLGCFLLGRLDDLLTRANDQLGEAYVLGDNPLVLLTALQSGWEPDPASSEFVTLRRPRITEKGQYEPNPSGHPIRVYTRLDTRLMLADFFAKVARFSD